MGQGQLDELAMRLEHEGDARGAFLLGCFVQDMMEGVGQTQRRIGLEHFADVGGLALTTSAVR
jgi:hypothetical protein